MARYIIGELYGCEFDDSRRDVRRCTVINKDIETFTSSVFREDFKEVTVDPLVIDYICKIIQNLHSLGNLHGLKGDYFMKTILPPRNISVVTVFSALSYVLLTMAEYNDIEDILPSDIKYAMNIILLGDDDSNEVETDPEIEIGNGFDVLENNGLKFSRESKSLFKRCIFYILSFCVENDVSSYLQRQRISMFASKIP